jgi:hypothetical protein
MRPSWARCFLENHIEEARMPVETIIVLAVVVGAFIFFAIVLANASRETDKLLRARAKSN